MPSFPALAIVSDLAAARILLHPLRMRLLALANEPVSAASMAGSLGLPRQRVNYHVLALARGGLLTRAGRRRKRNMVEQLYLARARSYLLAPELLGPLEADWRRIEDVASPEYLLALSARMQSDIIRSLEAGQKAGLGLPAFSFKSQFRLESEEEREAFTTALRDALVEVISRRTSPNLGPDGSPARGRPHRLVLGCYPYAPEDAPPSG